MPEQSQTRQDNMQIVLDQQKEIMAKMAELQKPAKDAWDKVGALSGVLIAIVGGLFSYLYSHHQAEQDAITQSHQTKLQEIQTVGTFMPYLVGNDDTAKHIALSELRDILSTKTAVLIAERISSAKTASGNGAPDTVVVNWLQDVANSQNTNADDKKVVQEALTRVVRRAVPKGP